MKFSPKYLLQTLFVNNIIYSVWSPFIFFADRLKASRHNYINTKSVHNLTTAANKIFTDNIVANGPFKGLMFSAKSSTASSIYAKLLGSYESEIHPFIYRVLQKKYTTVFNIGCDDGYYALGFAFKMPDAVIQAYDSNLDAITTARQLGKLNNLQHQVNFSGKYTVENIERVNVKTNSLFIVDCEGAERDIFTPANVHKLVNADLIIELHINIYPDLEEYFNSVFAATHHIEIANSIDDHLKAKNYSYPQLVGLDYSLRRFITGERDIFMQWMLLTAKNNDEAVAN